MDQHRLDRIRLLSARFHELQGLRVALAGASMAGVIGGYLTVAPEATGSGAMIAMVVSFLPVLAGMPRLNRYYASTFGRQVHSPARSVPPFLVLYFVVGAFLNAWIPAIPSGAPTAATVTLVSLWIAFRDWPWRAYYLVITAAAVIGFAASGSGAGLLEPNLTLGWIFFLIGVSMVPVGLQDHFLLVKLTREARESQAVTATNGPGGDA